MAMHVLVEPLPDGSGYRARTGAPLDLAATGKTPEEALGEIGRQLAEKWDGGARLYTLPGIPARRTDLRPPTAEEMQDVWAGVAEHLRECEEEDRRRFGIPDAPPAA